MFFKSLGSYSEALDQTLLYVMYPLVPVLTGVLPNEDTMWPMVNDSSAPGISRGQAGAFRTALCLALNLSVVFNITGSQEKAKHLTSVPGL